ncbi:phosphoribosylglycinamide formyltransferase, formyltetrahydrofolate-dependent [Candidatus Nitrososphaera evergladensis SR1]|uniref:phosphoribosylglycinamide formyltransferase 1 n=1 Tax=Candidatus Nitrososphaera evergladensis SR1 TaxID=1459636 RepID=A0A075N0E2_9ARCH|nr:phosphoribosylglycinamide formyltransferase [Candidatus Nitrososphaera evergladensis]AIF84959.1 phosphoribosylglycinamide formyltransferase, formyltetrahydrofolate-dependent [Candidatus Nitrososphaera evergladensis SR1]
MTTNLGILISGRGSNMDAILAAIKAGRIPSARPRIVISNKPDAAGLKTASEKYGVPTKVIPSEGLKGWDYDKKLVAALEEAGVTPENGLVCLAGFMRIISPEFVRHFKMRILNIHPALLPSFPGLHAQRQAVDYGVKVSGCTVHFVDEGVDSGPVILQRTVPVMEGDTEETLSARILEQEHQAYQEAVRLFAEGRLKVEGRKVRVL